MTNVIKRYRLLIIVMGLLMLAGLIWLIASRQNFNRIPSRGVLVYKGCFCPGLIETEDSCDAKKLH